MCRNPATGPGAGTRQIQGTGGRPAAEIPAARYTFGQRVNAQALQARAAAARPATGPSGPLVRLGGYGPAGISAAAAAGLRQLLS